MTMALEFSLASMLTVGDSLVTTTLCCSTSRAMEMFTRISWPAAS